MRYAILSDIHANLEAIRAVLARIGDFRVDRVLCLGDVVGYNADPNECVDLVVRQGIACVMGNHDAAACCITEPHDFNLNARQAMHWTRGHLSEENREFLRQLPRSMQIDDLVLCHGTVNDTNRYLLYDGDAQESFTLMEELPGRPRLCFFGHTHIRAAYSTTGQVLEREHADSMPLSTERRYLINPGSVGQPRDGDPQAAFLVYDTQERTITFHRVEYDIAACQGKIIKAGLPARLAERLSLGR